MAFTDKLHNRGSISDGHDIPYSLKLDAGRSEYLLSEGRTQGDSQQKWTYSTWFKRSEFSYSGEPYQNLFCAGSSTSNYCHAYFRSDGPYPDNELFIYLDNGGSQYWFGRTQHQFRDTSAWYHLVIAVDTTLSTANDRCKVYLNGELLAINNRTNPTQNASTRVGDGGGKFAIGAIVGNSYQFNGYIAETVLADGYQYAPTEFGKFDTNNVWVPIDVSDVSLGGTGFYINFDDSSNLGKVQQSNNQGNFSKYNITSVDQATDTPTNSFCILNHSSKTNGNVKISRAGTYASTDGGSGWCSINATHAVSKGKWYWEVLFYNDPGDTNTAMIGVAGTNDPWIPHRQGGYYTGNVATSASIGWYFVNGNLYNDASYGDISGPGYGDIAMLALDMDNLKFYQGINGTWATPTGGTQQNPASGTNGVNLASAFAGVSGGTDYIVPSFSIYQGNRIEGINFGGYYSETLSSAAQDANGYGNFEYAPPSGFYSLCTKNIAEFG